MNNPMQQVNFMKHKGSPPPATAAATTKKQRGGKTPASVRESKRRAGQQQQPQLQRPPPPRDRGGGPPLSSSGGPPIFGGGATTGTTVVAATARSAPTPIIGSNSVGMVDDAIARRKAELRRLKEKSKTDRANSATSAMKKRSSDLFPTVQPKSPSLLQKDTFNLNTEEIDCSQIEAAFAAASATKKASTTLNNNNTTNDDGTTGMIGAVAASVGVGVGPPPISISKDFPSSNNKRTNPNLPPGTPLVAGYVPPTPAVGRRLEFPSSKKQVVVPPPPTTGVPPSSASGGPPTTAIATATTTGGLPPPSTGGRGSKPPPPSRSQLRRRSRSKSPTPTPTSSSHTSNNSSRSTVTTKAKAAAALAERRRNRAKSAPPSRPPLPSGPVPAQPAAAPAGRSGVVPGRGSAAKALAKKKVKARSSNTNTSHRPTPIPASRLGLGLTAAAASASAASASGPPPSQSQPPTASAAESSAAVGIGSMDTSKTITTPMTQKSMYSGNGIENDDGNDDGQKTPPSTGSSSRRRKLQLMREQAGTGIAGTTAALALGGGHGPPSLLVPPMMSTSTSSSGTSTNASGPPATAAFAAAISGATPATTAAIGAGPPATTAFAAAIGATTATATATIASAVPPKTTLYTVPDFGAAGKGKGSATTTTTALPPPGKIASTSTAVPERIIITNDDTTNNRQLPPLSSSLSSSLHNESQSRLEEAYQKSERDKISALTQIKELEEKLNQKAKDDLDRAQNNNPPAGRSSSSSSNSGGVTIHELLQMADLQGSDAAVQWVKSTMKQQQKKGKGQQQVSFSSPTKPASRVGFDTGMGVGIPMMMTDTPNATGDHDHGSMNMIGSPIIRRRIANRTVTPHPTRHNTRNRQSSQDNNNTNTNNNTNMNMNDAAGAAAAVPPMTAAVVENPEETESRLIHQFREAAKYVPYEFSSNIATFTVRRPYGIDLQQSPAQQELFEFVKPPEEPLDAYSRRAHVSLKSSIDVVAIIKADNSPFLLFDTAGVRYKTTTTNEWIHIPNVDDETIANSLDRHHLLVGNITYVDEYGMECQYSLDEILEEALLVREQYCGTLTSTALGLDGRSGDTVQQGGGGGGQQQQQQLPLESQKAPSKDVAVETEERGIGTNTSPPPQQQQQQSGGNPPEKEEAVATPGLMSMLGSFVLNVLYGILIELPYRIICTVALVVFSYILFQIVYMHCAHGYNEWVLHLFQHPTNPITSSALTMNELVGWSNRQPGTV